MTQDTDADPRAPIAPPYITRAEWDQFEWHHADIFGGPAGQYVRGLRITSPPNDGFVYVRDHVKAGDTAQRWVRATEVG